MKKASLVLLTMTLAVPVVFAVDGVVLINQSTVMAAGGFPYKINQSGSYRLTGNLLVDRNKTAIQIDVNDVTLDLNGFRIECSTESVNVPEKYYCVGNDPVSGESTHGVLIRNGTISISSSGAPRSIFQSSIGISLHAGAAVLEDLRMSANLPPLYNGEM